MRPFREFGKPTDRVQPRGISLLEVLISIGILSVGLMAAMSLIPLGRTHLQKAGIDDRAATLIPSAYETMLTMDLFNKDSLGWISLPQDDRPGDRDRFEDEDGDSIGKNDALDRAQTIPMPSLGVTVYQRRAVFVERSTIKIYGDFWGELPRPGDPTPPPPRPADTVDWYRIPVEAGETLTVMWGVAETDTLEPDPTHHQYVQVSFGGAQQKPNKNDVGTASYAVPGDGFAYLQCRRNSQRRVYADLSYVVTIERTRADRVVAVDPLLAARLDKVLQLRNEDLTARSSPAVRRRYFADFNQPTLGAVAPRAFRIPRLTWQMLANPTVEESLALSDTFCRLHDDLAVDDDVVNLRTGSRDEYRPPRPDYVRDQAGAAWCRKSAGRMSWLLTMQPQAAGSVSTNWRPGSVFDVSIAVFQDRELPALEQAATITGEYAFNARWSEREGMLFIDVPQPFTFADEEIYLDDEDLRVLFRTGSWLLLAPLVTTDVPPIDDVQKLTWVRVQTVELEKSRTKVVVRVLPEVEPPPEVLLGANVNGVTPVVAIVHSGVVAVVTKQVTIGP